MNGIKMSDCKFYVDEEKRVVVCVIPHTQDMLYNFISENFRFTKFDIQWGLTVPGGIDMITMPSSFMGKAVCSEEDEWNEETGRLIAFSRAKNKCYRSFFKRANRLIQTVDEHLGDMVDAFNRFGTRLEDNRDGLQQRIEESLNK